MTETARHPQLFSPDEAAAYLHLPDAAALNPLLSEGWLRPYKVGRSATLYWRADLDDCALRIVGETVPPRVKQKALKLA